MAEPPGTANQPVLIERSGAIEVITLNRPRVYNAINLTMRKAIQQALERADDDPAVSLAVLTGAGGNFSSGRDLKATLEGESAYSSRRDHQRAFVRASVGIPVIAAVEGYALGGGLELALACDLLVASRTALFGLPEVQRNMVAIGGGLLRLPQRIPYHAAMYLALTGEPATAEELHAWGAVNELSEPGHALDVALELGGRIAENGPSAVRATKEIVRRVHDPVVDNERFEAHLMMAEPAMRSPDRQEGLRAFVERRRPHWHGR